MYFWNSRQLAEDIKKDSLSPKEYKNYYLLLGAGGFPVVFLSSAFPDPNYMVSQALMDMLIGLVITIIGIHKNYQANGGDQGKDFIQRSLVLALPITVKALTFMFSLILVWAVISEILKYPADSPYSMLFSQVIGHGTTVLIFWQVNRHLTYITKEPISS